MFADLFLISVHIHHTFERENLVVFGVHVDTHLIVRTSNMASVSSLGRQRFGLRGLAGRQFSRYYLACVLTSKCEGRLWLKRIHDQVHMPHFNTWFDTCLLLHRLHENQCFHKTCAHASPLFSQGQRRHSFYFRFSRLTCTHDAKKKQIARPHSKEFMTGIHWNGG